MENQPSRSCTAQARRKEVTQDIVLLFNNPFSVTGREVYIRESIFAYGEPHGAAKRKRMCPVMSRQAIELITGQGGRTPSGKMATVEHLVPRRVVRDQLRAIPWGQLDPLSAATRVGEIMDRLTLTAIITAQQDAHLRGLKLTSKMPAGWCPETGDPLERYRVAGLLEHLVVIGPLEEELTPPMAALLAGFPRHPDLVITSG